jgi:hypothetical protein
MQRSISVTGGGRIGWLNTTWPFATLKVDSKFLTLKVWPFGTYKFTRDEIVSIERHSGFYSPGIKVNHNILEYPSKIVFWHFGNIEKLILRILQTGFHPSAVPSSMPKRSSAVKWQTVTGAVIIWGALGLLNIKYPGSDTELGPFGVIALIYMLSVCLVIRKSSTLQNLFLKEGREVKEISDYLNALTIFSATFLLLGLLKII